MTAPKRIQRKRTPGWRMPEGAVNVTRPSDWSNPFRIGDIAWVHKDTDHPIEFLIDRSMAIALFRAYIRDRGWGDQIRRELAGKDLACWCRLDEPCHGDVLLLIANGGAP